MLRSGQCGILIADLPRHPQPSAPIVVGSLRADGWRSRDAAQVFGGNPIDRLALLDGFQHPDSADTARIPLERIALDDYQISEFSSLLAALAFLLFDLIRGHGGNGAQGVVGADPFSRSNHPAAGAFKLNPLLFAEVRPLRCPLFWGHRWTH